MSKMSNSKINEKKKDIVKEDIGKEDIGKEDIGKEDIVKEDIGKKDIKIIDLCAGTGAFSYVFHNKGCETIFANDKCINSKKIYDINFTTPLVCKDLCEIETSDIPEHDVLCAGFPCQPFSIAGKKEGFEDKRSNIFWKILDIVKYRKPEVLFLENVKNLVSHDKGRTFSIIKENIEKLGYHILYNIINTCEVSYLPQNRERIYIICFKNEEYYKKCNLKFEKVTHDELKNFLFTNVDKKYYYNNRFKVWDTIKENVVKDIYSNILYQYRRFYVRENKNNVCPTLTANMGSGGHNVPLLKDSKGVRKLTPKECFKLQGFPDSYNLPTIADSKLYTLAGNSVSIPVITMICDRILDIIK